MQKIFFSTLRTWEGGRGHHVEAYEPELDSACSN